MLKKIQIITDRLNITYLLFFLIALYLVLYIIKPNFLNSAIHIVEIAHVAIIESMERKQSFTIVAHTKENVITYIGGKQININRKYLNLSSYLVLILMLYVLPCKKRLKVIGFLLGFVILFFINLQRVLFVFHQTFLTQAKVSALSLVSFKLFAEIVPLLLVFVLRLFDKTLFVKIKNTVDALVLKKYSVYLFILTYYLSTILSDFFISITFQPFDQFIRGLTTSYLYLSSKILNILTYESHYYGKLIYGCGHCLNMEPACLGLKIMSFFALYILLFRGTASLKRRLKYLCFGIFIFYILNILRVLGLFAILAKRGTIYFLFTDHHEIFNFIIYLSMLFLCSMWMRNFKT